MLETSTNPLFLRHDLICVFTAVPSIVIGLECTEHTCYDIILINHDWENTNAIEFVRILRNLGVQTPLIMVHSDLCPQCMHEYHAIFCSFLQKPFSANALAEAIYTSLYHHIQNVRENNYTNDYLAVLSADTMDSISTNIDCFAGQCDFDSFYLSTLSLENETVDQKVNVNSTEPDSLP